MQGLGKIWSASLSFPRGSLLMNQSSTNSAFQIAWLATEVLVILGWLLSLLSSAFLVVWKIIFGASWIQLLVIFLNSLPDTAALTNAFFSLCATYWQYNYFWTCSPQEKTVWTCKCVLRGKTQDDFRQMLSDKKCFLMWRETNTFYYLSQNEDSGR